MNSFEKNMVEIHGELGREWLKNLPGFIQDVANKHKLTELVPVSNMTFNYVASGFKDGEAIILKTGMNTKALVKEAHCLHLFSNHGGANLLTYDKQVLIMHQAVPGTTLKAYFPDQENESISIFCSLVEKLHEVEIPENHNFYTVKKLLNILDKNLDIPSDILLKARHLRDKLITSTKQTVLLHGDLHHENILRDGSHWIVIDPKGFIGDPGYEVCPFLSNPIPELLEEDNPRLIIKHRVECCAERLGFRVERIKAWHYVHTILCWAWCLEDNLNPEYFKKLVSYLQIDSTD